MNYLALRRLKNLCKYGWGHAGKIAQEEKKGFFFRLTIFVDILKCYKRYYLFSNVYCREKFHKLDESERRRIGEANYAREKRRVDWYNEWYSDLRFLSKWMSPKYDTRLGYIKRNKAYTKRYNAGEGLWVQHDVNITREHELDGTLTIGKHVLLANSCRIDISGDVILHDHASISSDCVILSHEHKYVNLEDYIIPDGHPTAIKFTVEFGDHCAVGSGSVILASCRTIGRGALVGAGSVCRTSVPPYTVVMGNPAKVVGMRFSIEDILKIEEKRYAPEDRMSEAELQKIYKKYLEGRELQIGRYLDLRVPK